MLEFCQRPRDAMLTSSHCRVYWSSNLEEGRKTR